MHNHPKPKKCQHALQYCEHCDVVYCERCQEEWVKKSVVIYRDLQKIAPWQEIPTEPWNNPNKITWYAKSHEHKEFL